MHIHNLRDVTNSKHFKHSTAISEVLKIFLPHDTAASFKDLSWRGLIRQASQYRHAFCLKQFNPVICFHASATHRNLCNIDYSAVIISIVSKHAATVTDNQKFRLSVCVQVLTLSITLWCLQGFQRSSVFSSFRVKCHRPSVEFDQSYLGCTALFIDCPRCCDVGCRTTAAAGFMLAVYFLSVVLRPSVLR